MRAGLQNTGGVCIEVRQAGETIRVTVSDTGPGIEPEDQVRLFEPFEQVDTSIRRQHGGSGLGLAISKRFIEMHDGKIWLESDVGEGTTITFTLPIDVPPTLHRDDNALRWFNPYEPYEPRTRPPRTLPIDVPLRFVLLEEEGNGLRRLLDRYLNGYEIVSCRSVDEAIRALNLSPAQALLINTPRSSKSQRLQSYLSNLPYGTPAMTCWVPDEHRTARQLGVISYLVKPVTREVLLDTLTRLDGEIEEVLLVDDDREALQLFSRMIASAHPSYRILRAQSGQHALTLLGTHKPDVMLLDLMMPDMDGFQVLQEMKLDTSMRDVPVIVISSRDPTGEPIVSDRLTVSRSGGLSVRDLLASIGAMSEILSPDHRTLNGLSESDRRV